MKLCAVSPKSHLAPLLQSMPKDIACFLLSLVYGNSPRFLKLQIQCVQHVAGCSGMHTCLICNVSCERCSKDSCCVAAKHRHVSQEEANERCS